MEKEKKQLGVAFYRCSCGHCYGVCHWDYSYEQ